MAASNEEAFALYVLDVLRKLLSLHQLDPARDGLLMTGGCALNVKVNSALQKAFCAKDSTCIDVSPVPGDEGLAFGAAVGGAAPASLLLSNDAWKNACVGPDLFDTAELQGGLGAGNN